MAELPLDEDAAGAGPLIFLIAGEVSGDNLAGRLMAALKQKTGNRIRFAGVGGSAMAREGLESLFPMRDLSLMGLAEILPHLPRLLRRLRETVSEIERLGPHAVVTVDSPDFSFRVARRIRASGVPCVHYVAPQVWAWRQGRARTLAKLVDHVMALLPFEPGFFEGYGVPCTFVGHPVLEAGVERGDGAAFRARHGIAPEATLVSVLPGSRHTEVRRLLPVFARSVGLLGQNRPDLTVAVSTVDAVREDVASAVRAWPMPSVVVTDPDEKFDAFAASQAAVTKSGTVTLELALAGVPMVVCYKVSPMTAFLARRLVSVRFFALVNLLADRQVAPELMQEACTPEAIVAAVEALLSDEAARAAQLSGLREVVEKLGGVSPVPSDRAAKVVLEVMEQESRRR